MVYLDDLSMTKIDWDQLLMSPKVDTTGRVDRATDYCFRGTVKLVVHFAVASVCGKVVSNETI